MSQHFARTGPMPLVSPTGHTPPIQFIGLECSLTAGLHRLDDHGGFDGALLSVHLTNVQATEFVGSACMVAPGVAITAGHVVTHVDQGRERDSSLYPEAVGLHADGTLSAWLVRRTYVIPGTDAGILTLEPRTDVYSKDHISIFLMDVGLPMVGDQVVAVGLRGEDSYQHKDDGSVCVFADLYFSVGEVSRIYADGRDRVMMPGPCIEVVFDTLSGMSGGPVFNSDGHLIGINSTSMDGISWPSLLAPAIGQRICGTWPPHVWTSSSMSLAELSKEANIAHKDRVRFRMTPDGVKTIWNDG